MALSPAPTPLLARPAYRVLTLVALAALALAVFTGRKLVGMARLRGDIGDVAVRELVIQGQERWLSDGAGEYRLGDPSAPGAWTIQLTSDQAARHPRHSAIAVRCDGRECYLPDSVYISDGNMQFDAALLAVEIVVATVCALVVLVRVRAWRAARRGAHLPTVRVIDR